MRMVRLALMIAVVLLVGVGCTTTRAQSQSIRVKREISGVEVTARRTYLAVPPKDSYAPVLRQVDVRIRNSQNSAIKLVTAELELADGSKQQEAGRLADVPVRSVSAQMGHVTGSAMASGAKGSVVGGVVGAGVGIVTGSMFALASGPYAPAVAPSTVAAGAVIGAGYGAALGGSIGAAAGATSGSIKPTKAKSVRKRMQFPLHVQSKTLVSGTISFLNHGIQPTALHLEIVTPNDYEVLVIPFE